MNSPVEELLNPLPEDNGKQKKGTDPKPPGGKALQRLIFFSNERGLSLPPISTNGVDLEVKPKGKKSSSSETGTSVSPKSENISDTEKAPEGSDSSNASEYMSAIISAAQTLQEVPGLEERALTEISMSPPVAGATNWRFLGPVMMPNGQTYGDSRVTVSGRVSCIAVDPINSNHVLCGSAGGGVWETKNKGVNWYPRTDYMPTLTTGALAFNPSNPAYVYCGSGEGNFYGSLGAGVFRSTNGGTTWAVIATTPFVGVGFYDLIVDKANGNRLLAATSRGVYLSTDGGITWISKKNGVCWDIAVSPAGGDTAEILAVFADGIYRSTNWGGAWGKISIAGSPASYNRLAVDISRSNPAVAYIFGASGGTAYIYKRSSPGAWSSVSLPAGLSTGQAWYDWFLAISPDNDSEIYLGAIEAYRGNFSAGSWTWTTISNKAGDDIHPDQHAIAIDLLNPNVIYVGCDGGLFTSPNRGINWSSLNNGLGITEVEYMAQDLGSSRWIMAGTQDNGSIRYTGSAVWDHIADGDGGDCGVNRANPNTVFHSYYSMGLERSDTKGNFGSFVWKGAPVPTGYSALFYPPMEVNNDTITQAGQSVYISRNRGDTWVNVALPIGNIASAMYLPNSNTVFVGTTSGNVYRITWSGLAWSAASALTSPRNAYISDLYVSPSNLNRIWATSTTPGGGRVFRSDNGGSSWVDCTAGLPAIPINAIEVHPSNANRIWVAADVGVYQSLNAGSTWSAFSNGLPNAIAADLIYHQYAQVLRVGLRNRGVWEIPVDGWLTNPICSVQWTGTLSPNQTLTWFTFNWPATWHIVWTIMPTTVLPGAAEVTWTVSVERASSEYATYWIKVTNLTGQTISFEGRYAILNYY